MGYPCLISISEKSSVGIFLRNGFLNSAHFSTIGPTLKPFGLERVNKTPLALGLVDLITETTCDESYPTKTLSIRKKDELSLDVDMVTSDPNLEPY